MNTPRGLIVPVVKNVQSKSIWEIAQELNHLQELGVLAWMWVVQYILLCICNSTECTYPIFYNHTAYFCSLSFSINVFIMFIRSSIKAWTRTFNRRDIYHLKYRFGDVYIALLCFVTIVVDILLTIWDKR